MDAIGDDTEFYIFSLKIDCFLITCVLSAVAGTQLCCALDSKQKFCFDFSRPLRWHGLRVPFLFWGCSRLEASLKAVWPAWASWTGQLGQPGRPGQTRPGK